MEEYQKEEMKKNKEREEKQRIQVLFMLLFFNMWNKYYVENCHKLITYNELDTCALLAGGLKVVQ